MGDRVSWPSEVVLFAGSVGRFSCLYLTLVFVFVVAISLLCEEVPDCPMTGIKAVGGIPAKGGSPMVPFGMCQLPGFTGALCRFAGAGPRPFEVTLGGALCRFIASNCFEKCRDVWRRIRPRFQVRDHRARPVEAHEETTAIVRSILCGSRGDVSGESVAELVRFGSLFLQRTTLSSKFPDDDPLFSRRVRSFLRAIGGGPSLPQGHSSTGKGSIRAGKGQEEDRNESG